MSAKIAPTAKRPKYRLGEIFAARDIPIDQKSGGEFIALDIKHHTCAGLFVWKMSDADRSPEVEKAVTDLVMAGNAHDDLIAALQVAVDRLAMATEKHFTGYIGGEKIIAQGRAALAKAGAA